MLQSGEQSDVFYMHIPSTKTGLVIGRGGETIKQISQESGAHVELSREPPPNASEKVFILKGSPYQIHHAQHIIRIKVGDVSKTNNRDTFADFFSRLLVFAGYSSSFHSIVTCIEHFGNHNILKLING